MTTITENNQSMSQTIKAAYAVFKQNWQVLLGSMFFSGLFSTLSDLLVPYITEAVGESSASIANIIFSLLSLVLSMWMAGMYLQVIRNQKINWGNFSYYFKLFPKYFILTVLMVLMILAGLILFIIPGIVVAIRSMYAPYLVIDKKMGPLEALRVSSQMTKGKTLWLLGFGLVLFGVNILGALLFLVGLLVTIPVTTVAMLMIYDAILKENEPVTQLVA